VTRNKVDDLVARVEPPIGRFAQRWFIPIALHHERAAHPHATVPGLDLHDGIGLADGAQICPAARKVGEPEQQVTGLCAGESGLAADHGLTFVVCGQSLQHQIDVGHTSCVLPSLVL
jgi:hypothetical protein